MTYLVQKMSVDPPLEVAPPLQPTLNPTTLAVTLGVSIHSEPTNLHLAIQEEVSWRNELGSAPMEWVEV